MVAMNESENKAYLGGLIVGWIWGGLLAFILAVSVFGMAGHLPYQWRQKIVEHNAGQYNPQSGDFEWLDNPLAKN